ncbi:hypothetical protein K08M4_24340 [Vibrio syngnathi]|uniref:Uncharacterized protein n=1 Tax=Vibrio syngnathi TaxID=3034029 RepID=A0AA34TQA9_9VIBR|nr:hypothetical protein K08M4_24340 [Vibrio syngnathi]
MLKESNKWSRTRTKEDSKSVYLKNELVVLLVRTPIHFHHSLPTDLDTFTDNLITKYKGLKPKQNTSNTI